MYTGQPNYFDAVEAATEKALAAAYAYESDRWRWLPWRYVEHGRKMREARLKMLYEAAKVGIFVG